MDNEVLDPVIERSPDKHNRAGSAGRLAITVGLVGVVVVVATSVAYSALVVRDGVMSPGWIWLQASGFFIGVALLVGAVAGGVAASAVRRAFYTMMDELESSTREADQQPVP